MENRVPTKSTAGAERVSSRAPLGWQIILVALKPNHDVQSPTTMLEC